MTAARHAFPTTEAHAEELFAEGDLAAARIRWHGELLTGDVVDRETIDVVRVTDARAVEHWGAEAWSRERPASGP